MYAIIPAWDGIVLVRMGKSGIIFLPLKTTVKYGFNEGSWLDVGGQILDVIVNIFDTLIVSNNMKDRHFYHPLDAFVGNIYEINFTTFIGSF